MKLLSLRSDEFWNTYPNWPHIVHKCFTCIEEYVEGPLKHYLTTEEKKKHEFPRHVRRYVKNAQPC